MSSIKDDSGQESPTEEILEQTEDTEPSPTEPIGIEPDGPLINEEVEKLPVAIEAIDPKNNEPSMNQPSEVPEKMDAQIDFIQKTGAESLPLDNAQKNTNEVGENTDDDAHFELPIHESVKETPVSKEKPQTAADIPAKMGEDVENEGNLGPSGSVQESNEENSNKIEQSLNTTGVPEKMDEDIENNVHLEPSHNASIQESIEKTLISTQNDQKMTYAPEKMDEDEQDNGYLNPAQIDEKTTLENIENPENNNGDVVPIQECIWDSPLSLELARTETQAPKKMGEYMAIVQKTVDESLQMGNTQKEINEVSLKLDENFDNIVHEELPQVTQENGDGLPLAGAQKEKDEVLDKKDEIVKSFPLCSSTPAEESVQESKISCEEVKVIDVPEKIGSNILVLLPEDVTNSPSLENSQKDSSFTVIVEIVGDNTTLEASMTTSTQESIEESISLDIIQKGTNLSENMDVKDKTFYSPSEIAPNKADVQESPIPSPIEKEVIKSDNKNESIANVHLESSQIVHKQENIEESLITTQQEKEGNDSIIQNNMINIGQSQITLNESVCECSTLSNNIQIETNVERMDEDIDKIHVEPLQIGNIQQKYEKSSTSTEHVKPIKDSEIINENTANVDEITALSENDEEIKNSEITNDNLEPSQQEVAKQSPILSEQEKDPKKLVSNVDKKPTQITPKQQSVWESPITSETKVPKKNNANLVYHTKNSHSGALTAIPIQGNENLAEKLTENITKNKSNVNCGPLKAVSIHDSGIDKAPPQTQNMVENFTYNTNSAHFGSLKVVPTRDFTDKMPDKNPPAKCARTEPQRSTTSKNTDKATSVQQSVKKIIQGNQNLAEKVTENITKNKNNVNCGPLKAVSIQDSGIDKAPPQTQNMVENFIYNANSAHFGSLKVVPTRDLTECPPAKRAKTEPQRSTSSKNTDIASSLQKTVKKTTSPETHKWALNNASSDKSNVGCPAPSEVSALWESASDMSQSPCSPIEDTPMDIDSDDKDCQTPTDVVQYYEDYNEIMRWCAENDICKVNLTPRTNRFLEPLKTALKNTGVLRISQIPKGYNQADVYQLIKKHTCSAADDILKKIAFIYLDKTTKSEYNTAYIKWRGQHLICVIKAYELLNRAKPTMDGFKLTFEYDDRSEVEWDEKERPIIKSKYKLNWEENKRSSLQPGAAAPRPIINPFTNGEVNFEDTQMYGLNKEFLDSLNITKPVSTEVMVKNLDKELDEGRLHRIFGIAGTIHRIRRYLNATSQNIRIQYDHPLEAIQALSMFNQQVLYGRVMLVSTTLTKPHRMTFKYFLKNELPEGFTQIGRGLGPTGLPIVGVRTSIEVGQLKTKFEKKIRALNHKFAEVKAKLAIALESQSLRNEQMTSKPQDITATQQNPQNTTVDSQQNPQNAMTALTTAIASSIQTNILGMLGVQPNLFQGSMQQNQNPAAPNWSALNTETISWTQPNFTPNIQTVTNVQLSPANSQYNPNMEQGVPIPQPLPNQSSYGNVQQGYTQSGCSDVHWPSNIQSKPSNMRSGAPNMQPGPSNMQSVPRNLQSGFSNMQPGPSMQPMNIPPSIPPAQYQSVASVTSGFSNVQPALNPFEMYPPLPAPNAGRVLYDSMNKNKNEQKAVTRFDIPPVVAKPQNRGQKPPNSRPVIAQPIPPVTSYQLDIPLPVAKPQNRVPAVKTAFKVQNPNITTGSMKKVPKSVGIKFKIPSLQTLPTKPVPAVAVDSIAPSVSKPQKQEQSGQVAAKQSAYSKVQPSTSSKARAPEKPWINKQIKAMRRNSKSPEKARTPKESHEKLKDGRRSSEREYSRERERETERERILPNTVTFNYLPSSVTTDDLREKMCEIGKLVEATSTGKGRAFVSFRHRQDAETCIDMYHKAKVDNQTIEVKWAK